MTRKQVQSVWEKIYRAYNKSKGVETEVTLQKLRSFYYNQTRYAKSRSAKDKREVEKTGGKGQLNYYRM